MAGVSSCTTEARIRLSPRAWSVRTWFGLSPIRLRVRVILSFLLLGKGRLLRLRRGLLPERMQVLELPDAPEGVEGRLEDIVRVVGAERLGEDVLNPRRLQHRADGAARDETRPLRGRPQEDTARSVVARDLARKRGLPERDVEQVLLGVLHRLPDRFRDLVRLPEPDTDVASAVTHDHERGEREPPAAPPPAPRPGCPRRGARPALRAPGCPPPPVSRRGRRPRSARRCA